MRSNLRPSARAIDWPSEVLPTPGGPAKQRIEPRASGRLADGEELEDAVLDLLDVVVVGVEHLARVREVEVVLGALVPRQRRHPLEVGADDAVLGRRLRISSRLSSRSTCVRTWSGSSSSCRVERSSSTSASAGSCSPSSSWIAFSCWRRTHSRWPFSISALTWLWIFEPIATMSSSRARISDSRRRRLPTSTSSSSAWRSSLPIRSAPAIRWLSADGSSRLATAICSSSGRYGLLDDLAERLLDVAHQRGQLGTLVHDVGQLGDAGRQVRLGAGLGDADALAALDEDAQRAVRHLEHARDHAGDADVV